MNGCGRPERLHFQGARWQVRALKLFGARLPALLDEMNQALGE